MKSANEIVRVIELRNYLLKSGTRTRFVDHFARYFVESQNRLGGFVLGGFRIENEPDRFFWMRGFSGMKERSRFLPEFYGGEIWQKFGGKANEMMLEWHRVHLLKPFGAVKTGDFPTTKRFALVDFYVAEDNKLAELIDLAMNENRTNATFWVSETAANDFPRLPVIQDKNLLVRISGYAEKTELEKSEKSLSCGCSIKHHERLILSRDF